MGQVSFGTILRDARSRKGYDIEAVARHLRIRPDILHAIEASDFDRMPSRGYSRNMINAYARYLGLDPTEITHKYLDEQYAHQVHRAREKAHSPELGFNEVPSQRRSTVQRSQSSAVPRESRTAAPGRTLYADANMRSGESTSDSQERVYSDAGRRANRAALPTTQYTNFYSGPKPNAGVRSRVPFIIVGVVILILLIVILALVFGPKESGEQTDTPNVPVTGVSEPGQEVNSEDEEEVPQITKTAPTDFTLTFKVASGESAYIEVYSDDKVELAEEVSGPTEKAYRSSGIIRFITTNASAVSATIDGEEIELDAGDGWIVDETFDFKDILAAWEKENESPASSSSNGANARNTNNSNGTAPNNNSESGSG